jgi:hypothetical protein
VVEGQAGSIRGNVTNIPNDNAIFIYAYKSGEYTANEAIVPTSQTASIFPSATASDKVDVLGVYHIAYLAMGKYDLVVTSCTGTVFKKVLGVVKDITVESLKTTKQGINITSLK